MRHLAKACDVGRGASSDARAMSSIGRPAGNVSSTQHLRWFDEGRVGTWALYPMFDPLGRLSGLARRRVPDRQGCRIGLKLRFIYHVVLPAADWNCHNGTQRGADTNDPHICIFFAELEIPGRCYRPKREKHRRHLPHCDFASSILPRGLAENRFSCCARPSVDAELKINWANQWKRNRIEIAWIRLACISCNGFSRPFPRKPRLIG